MVEAAKFSFAKAASGRCAQKASLKWIFGKVVRGFRSDPEYSVPPGMQEKEITDRAKGKVGELVMGGSSKFYQFKRIFPVFPPSIWDIGSSLVERGGPPKMEWGR